MCARTHQPCSVRGLRHLFVRVGGVVLPTNERTHAALTLRLDGRCPDAVELARDGIHIGALFLCSTCLIAFNSSIRWRDDDHVCA